VSLPSQSSSLATTIIPKNGYYDQDIVWKESPNGTHPIYQPVLHDLYSIPVPVINVNLRGRNNNPVFNFDRATGIFIISYNCYAESLFVRLDTRVANSIELPCSANIIRYSISAQPLQFSSHGTIYTSRQFSGYDDALTWQQQNPTLFWFIIVFALIALPIALFLVWCLLVPALFHIALLSARLFFCVIWCFRVLTFRFSPPLGNFWHAISPTGNFSGPITSVATRVPPVQFERPSVPRFRYNSPYAQVMRNVANHYVVALFLFLALAAVSNGQKIHYSTAEHRTKRQTSNLYSNPVVENNLVQQVREIQHPNRFGDLYANTYTIQGVNGNSGSVLISFDGNVGNNQMLTYMPSSSQTASHKLASPVVVKFYSSSVSLATEYMYTTGPSKTFTQNSCVFFSQRCDNSPLSSRMPCSPLKQHSSWIGMDICCPTNTQSSVTYASCLDTSKAHDFVSCYNVLKSQPILNFTVTVDGTEYPVTANGDTFTAGSCKGSATPVLTQNANLQRVCCNHAGCKKCEAPSQGSVADTNHFGDIQLRGDKVIAAPLDSISRNIGCGFSNSHCTFTMSELGGYKQFNSPEVCNSDIAALYGCMTTVATHTSDTQENIVFQRCVNFVTLSMTCNASVIPTAPELLLTDFTVSCPQGMFGYLAGLVCNYTITNSGSTAVAVKPTGLVSNAVSPMLSVVDVVVQPRATATCYNCITLSSNVKKVALTFKVPGTKLSTSLTVTLSEPPTFSGFESGGTHSLTFTSCSYTQKLHNAWSNVGTWIGNNLAFFIPYFIVVALITVIFYVATFRYSLPVKYLLLYSVVILIANIILALVGPATLVVPGCD